MGTRARPARAALLRRAEAGGSAAGQPLLNRVPEGAFHDALHPQLYRRHRRLRVGCSDVLGCRRWLSHWVCVPQGIAPGCLQLVGGQLQLKRVEGVEVGVAE